MRATNTYSHNRRAWWRNSFFCLAILLGVWLSFSQAFAQDCQTNIVVHNTSDSGPGSLRQAILDACDGAVINFRSRVYGETITLTSGEITIDKDLIINGPGKDKLTIEGNSSGNVFHIAPDADVSINDLTITKGGSIATNASGILNKGYLRLFGVRIMYSNRGIYNRGEGLLILHTEILGNRAYSMGGGVFHETGILNITSSLISGNSVGLTESGMGGGIYIMEGEVLIKNTTIARNSASSSVGSSSGGGIHNQGGLLTISNSTLFDNIAGARGTGAGGGLFNSMDGVCQIDFSTFTKNLSGGQAPQGGGFHNKGMLEISNSIVAGNLSGFLELYPDVFNEGTVVSNGYNLIGINSAELEASTGDLFGTNSSPLNANLEISEENGMITVMPLANSPVINAGDPSSEMTEDQRKFARLDGRVDIGAFEREALPPSCLVISPFDGVPGSLRQTIEAATPECEINFHADLFDGVVALDELEILINKSLAIRGFGAEHLTISGSKETRVFHIAPQVSVSMSDLTITDGYAFENAEYGNGLDRGAGILNEGNLSLEGCVIRGNEIYYGIGGGGIFNEGATASLYITRSTIRDNIISTGGSTEGLGGGIYNNLGTVTIDDCQITKNSSSALLEGAGAIFNLDGTVELSSVVVNDNGGAVSGGIRNEGGTFRIIHSTIANNRASGTPGGGGGAGGLLNIRGIVEVRASTISGNSCRTNGGGIYNWDEGQVVMENSTVSDNLAFFGGGIYNSGNFTIYNSTIYNNTASQMERLPPDGGGLSNSNSGTLEMFNSVIAGNIVSGVGPNDVDGTFTSIGYNLIGVKEDDQTPADSDIWGTFEEPLDPMLSDLLDNGGPTLTHAPLSGSPVIDAGTVISSRFEDQRGFPSPVNNRTDIGAVEFGASGIIGLILIDPVNDIEMEALVDGGIVDLSQFVEGRVNIRAISSPDEVESVVFDINGDEAFHIENVAPYAFAGDGAGDYNDWWQPEPGEYTLTATSYSEANGNGTAGNAYTVKFTVVEGIYMASVVHFTLIDPVTDTEMGTLSEGDVVDMSKFGSGSLNIRANTDPIVVGSVVFDFNGDDAFHIENTPPYAFAGDGAGDYNDWWIPAGGTYTLTATPFESANGEGLAGESLSITFAILAAEERLGRTSTMLEDLKIYPNPTRDYLNVEIRGDGTAKIRILDLGGRTLIQTEVVSSNKMTIDLSAFPKGMYILEATKGKERVVSKFIKR